MLSSEAVIPQVDPVPPEAHVLINNGASATNDTNVTLSFVAYEDSADTFTDIAQMMISNDPFFTGANWQPFAQNVPWQIAPAAPGTQARVYTRFRDAAGNESLTEVGSILYSQQSVTPTPTVTEIQSPTPTVTNTPTVTPTPPTSGTPTQTIYLPLILKK